MIVAAGQAASVSGDIAANALTAARLTRLAASQQVRLLVLPEAFLTGYDVEAFAGRIPDIDDLVSQLGPLRAEVVAGGVTVVVGTALSWPKGDTLAQLILRPDGRVSAPYNKQHLHGIERNYFTPGTYGVSLEIDGLKLGMSICYDGCFPEHALAAARDGAVGYLSSAAYLPGSAHRRDLYYPARAVENGMYVVFSGLTGTCGALEFIGGSAIYDPEGRPVARLGDEEGLAIADLDPEVVAQTRATHTMLADHLEHQGPRRHSG